MSAETLTQFLPSAPPARKPRRSACERIRCALLDLASSMAQITLHKERAWASITFSGTRHTVRMVFAGSDAVEAGERFIAALPDHEFAIPGQLVADAAIASAEHSLLPQPRLLVECELLLLLDG